MTEPTKPAEPAGMPYDPSDIPHVLTQIARLGEGIKAEFDLIAGRMSWMVIAESFIFSAFATVIATHRPDHPDLKLLRYLAWILPFVGIFLAVVVFVGILAALRAVNTLKSQRERMMSGLPSHLQIDLISAENPIVSLGDLPAYVIPPVFIVVWALVYWFAMG